MLMYSNTIPYSIPANLFQYYINPLLDLSWPNLILLTILVLTILFLALVILILYKSIQVLTKLTIHSVGGTIPMEITSHNPNYLIYRWIGWASLAMIIALIFWNPFSWKWDSKSDQAINPAPKPIETKVLASVPHKSDLDPAILSKAKTIYGQYCLACHGDKGQGLVGPNLTDEYWIHGNKLEDIEKTIKNGVLANGMPSWEKVLKPDEIVVLAQYIKSIGGSNPANPKPAQGDKIGY